MIFTQMQERPLDMYLLKTLSPGNIRYQKKGGG